MFCWSNITRHLSTVLIFVPITRNSLTLDRKNQTALIDISCAWNPKYVHYAKLPLPKCALHSLPPFFEILPTSTPPSHRTRGVLISGDHEHVQWIKLVGDTNPPLVLYGGKNFRYTSIGVEFPALVSDARAIRHVVWQDLNDLPLLCGLVSANMSSLGRRMNHCPALLRETLRSFQSESWDGLVIST
jgi:hypothetical protein